MLAKHNPNSKELFDRNFPKTEKLLVNKVEELNDFVASHYNSIFSIARLYITSDEFSKANDDIESIILLNVADILCTNLNWSQLAVQ